MFIIFDKTLINNKMNCFKMENTTKTLLEDKLKTYSRKYRETRLFTVVSVALIVGYVISFWHKEFNLILMPLVFAHGAFAFIADKGTTKYGVIFYFSICVILVAISLYHILNL